MDVERPIGGWIKVTEQFEKTHINLMHRYEKRYMVLLVDFDERGDRLETVQQIIPDDLKDRVFVLGVLSEPEDLRKAKLGKLEDIGRDLARECRENKTDTWNHELLRHNTAELQRMTPTLRPILFPQA
jgi:hypothetical protein